MVVAEWVSYAGLAGGIAGTVLGCLAYRRTWQLKALDLRLELRKTDASLQNLVHALGPQLDYARRSRERVAAATGGLRSGAMQSWLSDFERDLATVRAMESSVAGTQVDYRYESSQSLESMVVTRHRLSIEARELAGKYDASIKNDEKQRDALRVALRPLRDPH